MQLARVKGTVVSTNKAEKLNGLKLQLNPQTAANLLGDVDIEADDVAGFGILIAHGRERVI